MHSGVFNTADVFINRHEFINGILSERNIITLIFRIAKLIPGRTNKGIQCIGFSLSRRTAAGTGCIYKGFTGFQRRFTGRHKFHVIRQFYRQLILRHRYSTALIAVNNRNRTTPVTLTGYRPVSQTIGYLFTAHAHSGQIFRHGFLSGGKIHTVIFSAVDKNTLFAVRQGFCTVTGGNDTVNRQTEFSGKFKVTLIMCRYSHNGTGAITGDNVIANPNRYFFTGQRVNGIGAGKYTGFFIFSGSAGTFDFVFLHSLTDIGLYSFLLFGCSQLAGQSRFRRQNDIGKSHQGIDSGGKDGNHLVRIFHLKGNLCTGASADPVFLDALGSFRPIQLIVTAEQFFSIISDFEEPLAHASLFNHAFAAFADTAGGLFIRQNGITFRTPVDQCLFFIRQTVLIELDEEPLCPLVIGGVTGSDFMFPVIGTANGS